MRFGTEFGNTRERSLFVSSFVRAFKLMVGAFLTHVFTDALQVMYLYSQLVHDEEHHYPTPAEEVSESFKVRHVYMLRLRVSHLSNICAVVWFRVLRVRAT